MRLTITEYYSIYILSPFPSYCRLLVKFSLSTGGTSL